MKKGQFALEFVILISFTILISAIFLVVIHNGYQRMQDMKEEQRVKEVMRILTTEVDLARGSPQGYKRTFYIPTSIDGIPYTVSISPDGYDVVFDYYGTTYVFFLTNGSLNNAQLFGTGYNTIEKSCVNANNVCQVRVVAS